MDIEAVDWHGAALGSVRFDRQSVVRRNETLRRIIRLISKTIMFDKPKTQREDGTQVFIYNNARTANYEEEFADSFDYAVEYTNHNRKPRVLAVNYTFSDNAIKINDFGVEEHIHNRFAFFYYPDGSQTGRINIVNEEDDVIPLLKKWLCIPKDRFFNDVFREVREQYNDEKIILNARRIQYDEDMKKILGFMTAASLKKNYDDLEHPMLRIAGDPDIRNQLMVSKLGLRP